jgi:hypothetical protein
VHSNPHTNSLQWIPSICSQKKKNKEQNRKAFEISLGFLLPSLFGLPISNFISFEFDPSSK